MWSMTPLDEACIQVAQNRVAGREDLQLLTTRTCVGFKMGVCSMSSALHAFLLMVTETKSLSFLGVFTYMIASYCLLHPSLNVFCC